MVKTVITGGPCSGKTSLINALENDGYVVVRESAIDVIKELQEERGLDSANEWRFANPLEFQLRIVKKQMTRELEVEGLDNVFFDRGVYDGIGYLIMQSVEIPKKIMDFAKNTHYDYSFMLDTLRNYALRENSGRTSNREKSLVIRENILSVYRRFGYEPVIISEFDETTEYESIQRRKKLVLEIVLD